MEFDKKLKVGYDVNVEGACVEGPMRYWRDAGLQGPMM